MNSIQLLNFKKWIGKHDSVEYNLINKYKIGFSYVETRQSFMLTDKIHDKLWYCGLNDKSKIIRDSIWI